ncbi:hypothetical protein [Leptospira alexanderi]|uniref:hypothetical protein n=1 Tax=Leptospira alexanderi TaxID=100053 RepID=UPI001FD20CB2|nr:hypothetical protein [Leptospira alexanderi]
MELFLIFSSNFEVGQVEYSTSTHLKRISIQLLEETTLQQQIDPQDATTVYYFPQLP